MEKVYLVWTESGETPVGGPTSLLAIVHSEDLARECIADLTGRDTHSLQSRSRVSASGLTSSKQYTDYWFEPRDVAKASPGFCLDPSFSTQTEEPIEETEEFWAETERLYQDEPA